MESEKKIEIKYGLLYNIIIKHQSDYRSHVRKTNDWSMDIDKWIELNVGTIDLSNVKIHNMDNRDYKAMNKNANSLGSINEIAVDFYLWMQENGHDHNIKQRVEGKFKEYYRSQLLKLNKSDVIGSVCNHSWFPTTKDYKRAWKCTECKKVVHDKHLR